MNAFLDAHRARRRFSTEQLLELRDLGITRAEAARRLGVTFQAVANRLFNEAIHWPVKSEPIEAATFEQVWNCHRIRTQDIADCLGVSRQAVSDRAKRLGLPSRAGVRRKISRDDEFRELYLAGVLTAEIARHFGYADRSAVTSAARRLGLPPRQRNGGRHGGWTGVITMRQFHEAKLAERMAAEAFGRRA